MLIDITDWPAGRGGGMIEYACDRSKPFLAYKLQPCTYIGPHDIYYANVEEQ